MKFLFRGFAVSVVLIFSACSKFETKDIVTDTSIRCSSQSIAAYNDINSKGLLSERISDEDTLISLKNSCHQLKTMIGAATCKAPNVKAGTASVISYSDVSEACSKVEEKLNPGPMDSTKSKAGPPAPTPVPPAPAPAPVPESERPRTILSTDSELSVGFPLGIELLVKNELVLNEAIKSGRYGFIQDGQTIRGIQNMDQSKDLCYFVAANPTYGVRDGDLIKLPVSNSNSKKLILWSADQKMKVGCIKLNSQSGWTLQDLQNIFAESAQIKYGVKFGEMNAPGPKAPRKKPGRKPGKI
jgi:hypothetical protein